MLRKIRRAWVRCTLGSTHGGFGPRSSLMTSHLTTGIHYGPKKPLYSIFELHVFGATLFAELILYNSHTETCHDFVSWPVVGQLQNATRF